MKFKYKNKCIEFGLPILTGILLALSILLYIHWLAWFALIPLFISINVSYRFSIIKGFESGFMAGLFLFSWMIKVPQYYSGSSTVIGFPFMVGCSIYYGLVIGIIVWIYTKLSIKQSKYTWWYNAILMAAIWVLMDWIRITIMPGIPWVHYQPFHSQEKNVYILQILSIAGPLSLTFIIVFINKLAANVIHNKKYNLLLLPIVLYILLISFGFLRLAIAKDESKFKYKVAILCENIEAKTRWQPETGDSLAGIFFNLNQLATKENPTLIVWSEAALPWSLEPDDNLIAAVLKLTWPVKATHILGIFTDAEDDTLKRYNSAYCIQPDGTITGRYDKTQLLTFLEKPLLNNIQGSKLKFFTGSIHTDLIPGNRSHILITPCGKAGILICNENLVYSPVRKAVNEGADFLILLSNDAWFEGNFLVMQHFYNSRLRAIEFGIDLIINSNKGVSAIINRYGKIECSSYASKPTILSGYISKHGSKTIYSLSGNWIIVILFVFLFIISIIKVFKTPKN